MTEMADFEIGQIVDFCIEWNKAHKIDEEQTKDGKKSKPKRREATQADMDAFWG